MYTDSVSTRVAWFAALSGLHGIAFYGAPESISGVVLFVTLLPWLPLIWIGAPVSTYIMGFVPIPNLAGAVWCIGVWLVIYWFISGAVAKRSGLQNVDRSRILR